jgi:glycosyltransferase involved in cell wall biosynthesis
MDRKLSQHSNLVINYLKFNLNKNWQIKNLKNLSENKTYELLKKSKIFLSFSNLEGFGLPPLEAALAGNTVIGYTGQGGNEYWKKPLFIKINSGEVNKLALKVIEVIKKGISKIIILKLNMIFLKKSFQKKMR